MCICKLILHNFNEILFSSFYCTTIRGEEKNEDIFANERRKKNTETEDFYPI